MSNADKPHRQFNPSEGEPDGLITVEDLLSQLDRIAGSTAPEFDFDQDGLDRLMTWMSSDASADHDLVKSKAGGTADGPVVGKILIAGGQRAGSVDFITEISEFSAWTEIHLSDRKSPSTQREVHDVFFGRITLSSDLQLYTATTPDFIDPHVWDEIRKGALGALVLADPRRLVDCYPALDYLDHCGMPYVLALRGSSERCPYDLAEIREALRLPEEITILFWEPGWPVNSADALIAVVEAALKQHRIEATTGDDSLDEEMIALSLLTQLELFLQ